MSYPWDEEPDEDRWVDPATGVPCKAWRHPSLRTWCGYVRLPEGHPWLAEDADLSGVDVHGGITGSPSTGPDPEMWVGFDCAHGFDLWPDDVDRRWSLPLSEYRTLTYVRSECAKVAAQAAVAGLPQ